MDIQHNNIICHICSNWQLLVSVLYLERKNFDFFLWLKLTIIKFYCMLDYDFLLYAAHHKGIRFHLLLPLSVLIIQFRCKLVCNEVVLHVIKLGENCLRYDNDATLLVADC